MKDNYITRKIDKFQIVKRTDKTVHKNPSELTLDQINSYNSNGFVIIKDFFSKSKIKDAKKRSEEIFNNDIGYIVNKEPESSAVRSALKIHLLDEFIALIDKRLVNISSSILGGKTYIHQSRINYKHGKSANGWNWHSDFETWHAKDGMPNMNCFTAMVVIDSNTIENGCINFIPKSHNSFISCPKIGDTKPDSEFSEQTEGVPSDLIIDKIKSKYKTDTFSAVCNSGDLVLFDCNTLHYSGKNTTNDKRTNLYFVFNSVKNKLSNPFDGGNHRPEEMGCTNPVILN